MVIGGQITYIDDTLGPLEKAEYLVIPNGEKWELTYWWGSANPSRDTHVAIIWDYDGNDPEILALTHGDIDNRGINIEITGDGVKKLAIVLRNDEALMIETLGAGYYYKVIE